MQESPGPVPTLEVLRATWSRIQESARAGTLLVAFGLILPEMALTAVVDVEGAAAVDALRTLHERSAELPVMELLQPALAFVWRLALAAGILGVLTLAGYFALVHLVVEAHRRVELGAFEAWKRGLGTALRRGLLLAALLALFLLVGQVLIVPAIAVTVLGLMAPVLVVAENKGAWRALMDALAVRYARRSGTSGWSVVASLVYLAGLFFIVVLAAGVLGERLHVAAATSGLPEGPAYAVITFLTGAIEQTSLAALPFMTVTLYFAVTRKRELAQA